MKQVKRIIFDLDGTLWQTRSSYVYAYQKLCEQYNIKLSSYDEVLKYMGVKVDILLKELFPNIKDQYKLAYEALNYSIEYILQNPDETCFDDVYETLEALSKDYEIYIVSNCLKAYVETFLSVSKTHDFIKDFFTIELGEKHNHVARITENYTIPTLFVGDSDDDYEAIKSGNTKYSNAFFCFADYGYKESIIYDYKINNLREVLSIVKSLNQKLSQIDNSNFKVFNYKGNSITLIEKKDIFYFGYVDIKDISCGQTLIDMIDEYLNENNISILLGPINNNTWYSYRFPLDNYDWVLYPDCNGNKEVLDLFIRNGFNIKQTYSSSLATINHKVWARCKQSKLQEEYSMKLVSGKEAYLYLPQIYNVAIKAFSQADFYEEISFEDFSNLYMKNIELCSADLILIYYKDEVVAFNFCYEDLEKRFYVSKTIGINPSYRNDKVVFMKLVDASYDCMCEKGYSDVLYHFTNDRTKVLSSIMKGCLIKKKTYGLLEKVYEK